MRLFKSKLKWTSNEAKALDTLPEAMLVLDFKTRFAFETAVPVLGISWHPTDNCFRFQVGPQRKNRTLNVQCSRAFGVFLIPWDA